MKGKHSGNNPLGVTSGGKVPTPECDKMLALQPESQACGAFYEWLTTEKGWVPMKFHKHTDACVFDDDDGEGECDMDEDTLYPVAVVATERLLAEYFEIDLDKVEAEKRAILEALRS